MDKQLVWGNVKNGKAYMKIHGFTLIELLVVIAIITILATLLQPAIMGGLKKAKIASAQTEISSIANAVRAYYTEYGRMPTALPVSAQDPVFGEGAPNPQNDVLKFLAQPTNNLRRILFLEMSPNSIKDGNFVDPWERAYCIVLDNNYDGSIKATLPVYGELNLSGMTVAVYSLGPDGTKESVLKSW